MWPRVLIQFSYDLVRLKQTQNRLHTTKSNSCWETIRIGIAFKDTINPTAPTNMTWNCLSNCNNLSAGVPRASAGVQTITAIKSPNAASETRTHHRGSPSVRCASQDIPRSCWWPRAALDSASFQQRRVKVKQLWKHCETRLQLQTMNTLFIRGKFNTSRLRGLFSSENWPSCGTKEILLRGMQNNLTVRGSLDTGGNHTKLLISALQLNSGFFVFWQNSWSYILQSVDIY